MVFSRLQPDGKIGNTEVTDNRNILINLPKLVLVDASQSLLVRVKFEQS